jgi:hypothetical protein
LESFQFIQSILTLERGKWASIRLLAFALEHSTLFTLGPTMAFITFFAYIFINQSLEMIPDFWCGIWIISESCNICFYLKWSLLVANNTSSWSIKSGSLQAHSYPWQRGPLIQ